MRKLIAILFIVAFASTLLPGVFSWDQKKISLFSAVEEESCDNDKAPEKDDAKEIYTHQFLVSAQPVLNISYHTPSILFTDDPLIGHHTPPPDFSC